mmetsp:Transcript_80982/g.196355  ORF Transcript_80982/g.196355 Transcript_80982/m.196355 type:complete len:202 (-) Transcript_80982:287-892(-)
MQSQGMGSWSARRRQGCGLEGAALARQGQRPARGLSARGRRGRAGSERPGSPWPRRPARGSCGQVGNLGPADAVGGCGAVGGGRGVAVRRPPQPRPARRVRRAGGGGEAAREPRAVPAGARGEPGPGCLDPGSRDSNRRGQRPLRDVGHATEVGRVGFDKESLPMPKRGRDTGQEGRPGALASLHGFQKRGGSGEGPHNWR